jgi:hypothetical protein
VSAAVIPAWSRTPAGWAVNLDGSLSTQFALPRLELEQGALGWICRCRLADGTSSEMQSHAGSLSSARHEAVEMGRALTRGAWTAALEALGLAR